MNDLKPLSREGLPSYIISILQQIGNHGFRAFIVGGAIRDRLLGAWPCEFDLASNARPDDIIRLFKRTTQTGVAYGTVTIHMDGHAVEITSFRNESRYTNHRHPQTIEFVDCIDDDLKRRDFTMNAMAYCPFSQQLIDLYDGQTHLKLKKIVCVGDPAKRFYEDTLRPFRAFRFMSQYGFSMADSVNHALRENAMLPRPSMPRIRYELSRLLRGDHWAMALTCMHAMGWLHPWVPVSETLTFPSTMPRVENARWAGLLSQGDFEANMAYFQFSKHDCKEMRAYIDWAFDPDAVQFQVTDLAISSKKLQLMGFVGKDLGDIQRRLVMAIRKKNVMNQPDALIKWVLDQRS
jgi:tRNA nucleotidyltransferase/poly(A) polymerase